MSIGMEHIHKLYTLSYVLLAIYIAYSDYPPLTLKTALASMFFGLAGVCYLMGRKE
jgi:hypothetical protein